MAKKKKVEEAKKESQVEESEEWWKTNINYNRYFSESVWKRGTYVEVKKMAAKKKKAE